VQVERMVTGIAAGLAVPLTAKIRIFPELHRTLAYARMLERCGVQLLAVHGRTRDQKDSRAHKADWDAIKVGLSTCKAEGTRLGYMKV
jgi:tRNA-dihydrouridine synthase 1